MAELRYWVWLTTVHGLPLRTQTALLDRFQTPEAVFLADREALEQSGLLSERELQALERRDLRRADQVLEDCRREQIGIITIRDAIYPGRLRAIDSPPLVLYYRGNLLAFDSLPVVAVVGARSASAYGLTTAKRMGYQLGACGGTVISGAARGVDMLAVEGALGAGGSVAAVLGNGLDIVYPSEAGKLYADVAQHGCLISEYIPGTRPLGANFPRRNRILSGLSLAVLVVEATKKSGSLITAEFALEQGRDVFAIPGNIGLECCEGSNRLIQEGAGLATCGWDIMQGYATRFPQLIRRAGNGNRLTLSTGERRFFREGKPDEHALNVENSDKSTERVQENIINSEKRIDNEPKSDYNDIQQRFQTLTSDERTLAELLRDGQKHVDDLIAESEMTPAGVLASLTLLEVKGIVTQQPGKLFALNL